MSWCELPADLVSGIADRITEHADLARFRSVCPSWRSASAAHAARRRVPLLLVPSQFRVNRRLWSLVDDSVVEVPFPEARGFSFLYASPRGWTLGVSSSRGLSATLLHPFTGASESLPALPPCFADEDQRILRNMVWDRSPDAVVVSPRKGGALFCRLRPVVDASWSPVTGCCSSQDGRTSSIAYCDGTFYLLDGRARRVTAVDGATFAVAAVIEPPPPRMVKPRLPGCEPESTLIASPGELLLLVRTRLLIEEGSYYNSNRMFKVFRADHRNLAAGWSDVTDGRGGIGDRAVFVDHLRGFLVEANGVNGVKRNSMYVASAHTVVDDDYGMDVYANYTVSVLDLTDLTTEDLYYGNLVRKCRDGSLWQWPSWFMPNLY
uniref:Uncharacterized protein n=1 Tax=Avena sativa TaxID=4498 RepID=A0ACD5U2H0_AVESA